MMLAAAASQFDAVISAQATFRAIMSAMARPGTVWPIQDSMTPPAPLWPAMAAFALAMIDHETPVWLDPALRDAPDVMGWLHFHTGAPLVEKPMRSAFALISDAASMPPLDAFNAGTPEYPDRSTTIVAQVQSLERGPALMLSGPGIDGEREFRASRLPDDMLSRLAANRGMFPLGVDFVLVAQRAVAALPRSVRTVAGGS